MARPGVVSFWIEFNIDVDNACAQCGYTPLIRASEMGRADFVRLLLDAGADKEAKNAVRVSGRVVAFAIHRIVNSILIVWVACGSSQCYFVFMCW